MGVTDIVNPIKMDSHEAACLFDDESLNFIFMDDNHEYEHFKKDVELWYTKVEILMV